jgi:AraC-like DNA-binding protein
MPVPSVLAPALHFHLLESKLIWVQDRHLEKSRRTNAITVEDIPAWFVRGGRLVVKTGGERLQAGAGHWVLPRQGQGWVHTLPNSRILSLRFRLRWPNGQEVYRRRQTLVLAAKSWPGLTRAADTLLAAMGSRDSWHADRWAPASCLEHVAWQARFYQWLAAYGQVMEAHGLVHGALDQAHALALETRQALLDWDLARPFSRRLLSRQLGAGVQTLSRRFAAQYGTTPRAFLEQRRLEWAEERLAHSHERVKAIAGELGFVNLAQFSNWFRARNQVSPREYRRQAQTQSVDGFARPRLR